jgi:hypothetical protein
MELHRKDAIQTLIDKKGFKKYLEIGVFLGHLFFEVKAKEKVAVDPEHYYGWFKRLKRSISKKNPSTLTASSYKLTSDKFFSDVAPELYKEKDLDLSFVDGLHEYQYALRDVENSLKYIKRDGVVMMHDCNPMSKEANDSFENWKNSGYKGFWNGDVWKAVVHLRSTRNDINVFVLDSDHGLGVVTYGQPETMLNFTPQQIAGFTYEDLERNRKEWLNLKDPSYFYDFFKLPRS